MTQLLTGKYDEAKELLIDNRDVLDRIAMALLERETLETNDLDLILKNQDLPPFEKVIEEPSTSGGEPKPESSGGFSGGGVPDPEPMPS